MPCFIDRSAALGLPRLLSRGVDGGGVDRIALVLAAGVHVHQKDGVERAQAGSHPTLVHVAQLRTEHVADLKFLQIMNLSRTLNLNYDP